MKTSSLRGELETVTKPKKRAKNDVAFIVFLKNQKKAVCHQLLHENCYIFPSKAVVSSNARAKPWFDHYVQQ